VREQQDALNRRRAIGPKTTNLHISSKKTAGQRSDLLREFVDHKRALMTNARCLTEGVDVPAIDCVMFADPKQSRIDIVQAAGRALRRYRDKKYGYIAIPLVVPENMEFEQFAETIAFRQVAQTITALSTQDERIAEEFRAIEKGRVSSGKIVEIEGDVPIGMKMKLGDFAEAISTRVWESVGRANWRAFEDARAFVRRLGLKSSTEWSQYSASEKKPNDIPAAPRLVYANDGWVSWGDWLGTGRINSLRRAMSAPCPEENMTASLRDVRCSPDDACLCRKTRSTQIDVRYGSLASRPRYRSTNPRPVLLVELAPINLTLSARRRSDRAIGRRLSPMHGRNKKPRRTKVAR
jgi:hypothetical protein